MSRDDSKKGNKASGRQGGNFRKKSYARGNAPIKKNTSSKQFSDPDSIRLNKYVSNSGVCSRRDADIYIAAGSVTVNGKPITEMGYKVKLTDEVKFDGQLLNPVKKEYVLLNKPKDFTTSIRDEKGKRHVSGLISSASKSKLLPVDKLDKEDVGLLLFTNDGDLTKRLKSPINGLRKIFHLVLDKDLRSADLKKIQEGVLVDEKIVKVQDISYITDAPKREVGIEIYSSRGKIVQRLFEQLDYKIIKLDRVVYGGLTKKDLPRGHWRYLTEQEIINLKMIK
ncbi:S4 domain-containing protein [Maribacter sp. PR1]|uniref:S4 domain-containing protein n=1 Tax=Maribacter cobaltidurans TaxID=1178778 RepID=A0ABU7IS16_9FLAO|nr:MULTISPECIES: S4 domain-containing protein [Maribacter]MDC6388285.1 S4 domain-containing protein [Maribacter sp. PR1]MEE1975674.1 S4 domain-containing protein [Maribacter cobaltidurans]